MSAKSTESGDQEIAGAAAPSNPANPFDTVCRNYLNLKAELLVLAELEATLDNKPRYGGLPKVLFLLGDSSCRIYPEDVIEFDKEEYGKFKRLVLKKLVRNHKERCFYDRRTGGLHKTKSPKKRK